MFQALLCAATVMAFTIESFAGTSKSVDLRIDTTSGRKATTVPISFLGLSHEPLRLAKNIVLSEGYAQMITNLASYNNGPFVIRWGGNSQDEETVVYDDSIWTALADLHKQTGVRYMLGLRLPGNNISYAQTQVSNALRILPPEAIVSFAVGNEPDNYPSYRPEYQDRQYHASPQYFLDEGVFMQALAPILKQYFGTAKMFSGPGVFSMRSYDAPQVEAWGTGRDTGPYAALVTAHWYAARGTLSSSTVQTFLDEKKIADVMMLAGRWAGWARKYGGLPFRLEETNSLNIEGKYGVSDTMGSALFALDYALTMVQAGAAGMNFHNHDGCLPYSAIVFPKTCSPRSWEREEHTINHNCDTNCGEFVGQWTGARPLYYGMWMFAQAVEGRAQVLEKYAINGAVPGLMKAFAIKNATHTKVVLINKGNADTADVSLSVTGTLGDALAIRLSTSDPAGLLARGGVSLAGQTVAPSTGQVVGARFTEVLKAGPGGGRSTTGYTVRVPPASAVVLWALRR